MCVCGEKNYFFSLVRILAINSCDKVKEISDEKHITWVQYRLSYYPDISNQILHQIVTDLSIKSSKKTSTKYIRSITFSSFFFFLCRDSVAFDKFMLEIKIDRNMQRA